MDSIRNPDSGRRERNKVAVLSLLLVLVTLAVYWQVRNHGFLVWDDYEYVVENPHVRSGLRAENVLWAFTTTHASNWHPLTWLSHMLDCHVYGLNPSGHHLHNLLLHLVNTVLLFLLLEGMTRAVWRSAFVAAVFALHPLHVESVAWISERKDVLSTLFWFLTCWTYYRYTRRSGVGVYFLCLAFFTLGLMSKPMLVSLPFSLLLLDYWPLDRFRSSPRPVHDLATLVWEKLPFFSLAAASGFITFFASRTHHTMAPLEALPMDLRFANALVSYIMYAAKSFWPSHLAFFYPHPLGTLPLGQAVGSFFLLATVTWLVLKGRSRYPYLVTGWFWYLGTLLPVIGLIQVGSQAMADRYTYVPLIGLSLMMAWGIPDGLPKGRYKGVVLFVTSGTILLVLSILSRSELRYWSDGISLFKRALQVTSGNYVAQYQLGNEYLRQRKAEEAIRHFSEAVKIKPDHFLAHHNLGSALLLQGHLDEAIQQYREAIRIRTGDSNLYLSLGNALGMQGRWDEAAAALRGALEADPANWMAHTNLGYVFLQTGRTRESIRHFSEALRINPEDRKARHNLGLALKRLEN